MEKQNTSEYYDRICCTGLAGYVPQGGESSSPDLSTQIQLYFRVYLHLVKMRNKLTTKSVVDNDDLLSNVRVKPELQRWKQEAAPFYVVRSPAGACSAGGGYLYRCYWWSRYLWGTNLASQTSQFIVRVRVAGCCQYDENGGITMSSQR